LSTVTGARIEHPSASAISLHSLEALLYLGATASVIGITVLAVRREHKSVSSRRADPSTG